MEEKDVVIPATTVEPTTDQPSSEQPKVEEQTNKGVSFDAQQQAKLNSLLKEEREKILRKLNSNSIEELQAKLEKADKYDTLLQEKDLLKDKANKVNELVGENALLKANIKEDMTDVVKSYFKGAGKELNTQELENLFKEKPALKEMWVKAERQPVEKVIIGNPKSNVKSPDDGYAQFLKDAGLKSK